jgi:hypothetical protein
VNTERGAEFLVDGRFNCEPDVLVDQFAERDSLTLLRGGRLPDTLVHGAFLRWPPCQAARLIVHFINRKNAPSSIFPRSGTRPDPCLTLAFSRAPSASDATRG